MARPHKQTVDYFPHDTDASEGKTLTIIQAKFGNDGYAFWFKLLQLLGKTSGHYYNFNNPADWEFLLAKTHQNDTETAKSILSTLAILDAIDAELFENGVIWCQNFVDGISDAYNRTVEGKPLRPDFLVNVGNQGVSVGNQGVSVNNNGEKPTEIPQTKRRLKETKLKETILPDFIDKETWESYLKSRKKPTEHAIVLLLKKLEEFRNAGDDPNEILKRSIMNGWTGIFKLDKKGGSNGVNRGHLEEAKGNKPYTRPPAFRP